MRKNLNALSINSCKNADILMIDLFEQLLSSKTQTLRAK
jgi:hypothetical protein